jgi:hypothetical protein
MQDAQMVEQSRIALVYRPQECRALSQVSPAPSEGTHVREVKLRDAANNLIVVIARV